MKDSNTEIEELQNYGGGTSIRFKILSEEVRLFLGGVWFMDLSQFIDNIGCASSHYSSLQFCHSFRAVDFFYVLVILNGKMFSKNH